MQIVLKKKKKEKKKKETKTGGVLLDSACGCCKKGVNCWEQMKESSRCKIAE